MHLIEVLTGAQFLYEFYTVLNGHEKVNEDDIRLGAQHVCEICRFPTAVSADFPEILCLDDVL